MSQQIFDVDSVGFSPNAIGHYFDFYVNNTFYLLAPEYYYSLYSIYFNKCLAVYDGLIKGWHNTQAGIVPQRMLQSIATGLNNMLFAHGIDFSGADVDYQFAVKWAKKTKFYKALKKAHKFAIAGGTSLIMLNRRNKELYATAHRIDTFFADIDANGKVTSVTVFFDAMHNTNPSSETKTHFGLCEERYYNDEGKPCSMVKIYRASDNLQTEVGSRTLARESVDWQQLPRNVQRYLKDNYPSVIIGEEQYLPFPNSLGCYLLKFTDDIPQIPNTQFGQPIGDILFDESFQYDQLKYFEKNEVDLARARALVPEEFWNKDDPDYQNRALNERFYQKISSVSGDSDKVTPIQFALRANDIRVQKDNVLKACAFKLNVSASSIASFLSEGDGARTATEIVGERTKSDTWIKGQINLNAPEINELLKNVMYYYNYDPVEIVLKAEDQSPFIERIKVYSDVFSAGNMSPEMFVKMNYTGLSQAQQQKEIQYLQDTKRQNDEMRNATMNSWQEEK